MRKRFFATVLILALAATLCPAALAEGKLSTPTDLAWDGRRGLYTMTWNWEDRYTGIVRFALYRDDCLLVQEEFECSSSTGGRFDTACFLAEYDLPQDSGVYHFTVQSIVDFGSDSEDSGDVAISPKWAYTAPDAQIGPPTDLSWDFPYHVWRRGLDVYEIQTVLLQLYFCESEDGDYQMVSDTVYDIYYDAARLEVDTQALEKYGAGYYKFRIFNLSDDLGLIQSSPWSAYSEPYYYDGSTVEVCEHRNYITSDDEKMPTCTEPGYTQDTICADCGTVIFCAENLPAKGHDPDINGVCQRWGCGARVADRAGTLGEGNGALNWTYTAQTGAVAFKGVIPVGETVFVACYQDGRFTGVKTATGSSPTVEVGTTSDRLRLFWLDGRQAPKCQAVGFTLAQ